MKLEGYTALFAERILEALQKGTAPWQRPMEPGRLELPRNGTTGRPYRGTNSLLLRLTGMLAGYEDPRWAGFHQIRKAGGRVRKGQHGTPVLVWRTPKEREEPDEPLDGSADAPAPRIYAAFHYVFNAAQADGWELPALATAREPSWNPREIVAQVVEDARVEVRHANQSQAYYSPSRDVIVMPERGQFPERNGYEHTLLHELAHATMHESRLNRPEGRAENREAYALEELRAEISAMMAGERLEVGHAPRHGHAYVASWIKALENDPDQVRRAAADAERIASWLTRHAVPDEDAGTPAGTTKAPDLAATA